MTILDGTASYVDADKTSITAKTGPYSAREFTKTDAEWFDLTSGKFGVVQDYVRLDIDLEADIRTKRDLLLTASDWTQVADAPVDQAAWASYRQALRDIPDQPGFPHNVAWPTKP